MIVQREDRIRRRAYEIWEQEGRPPGCEAEHWQRAAAEIDREGEPASGDERLNVAAHDPGGTPPAASPMAAGAAESGTRRQPRKSPAGAETGKAGPKARRKS